MHCNVVFGAANQSRTGDLVLTKDALYRLSHSSTFWQGQKDLNPRHAVLETAALPTELYPYVNYLNISDFLNLKIGKWWAFRDSNPGPTGYEPVALTN